MQDCFTVTVHDLDIIPPLQGINLSHAKTLASEQALTILSDEAGQLSLKVLCNCPKSKRRRKKRKKKTELQGRFLEVNDVSTHTSAIDQITVEEENEVEQLIDLPKSPKDLDSAVNDETTEGFALKGLQLSEIFQEDQTDNDSEIITYSTTDEEIEVERMLLD